VVVTGRDNPLADRQAVYTPGVDAMATLSWSQYQAVLAHLDTRDAADWQAHVDQVWDGAHR
jgi:hypothetical protein